jgi:hypothetical protein
VCINDRTVRDRQLKVEESALDIHLRQLDDVVPLDWQRVDYEHKHNRLELKRMIEGVPFQSYAPRGSSSNETGHL